MKNNYELKEKEIIDAKGNTIGNISDVNWNPESNKVKFIIVTQGGAPAKT
jgi:sporulation protein YlmC with PRC-barrel domain